MRNDSSDDRIAVIYDRASRQQQANNYSRDDAARLYELAEREGMKWELRKEVKSGEHLSNRPVMRKLLDDIETDRVAAIICQDFSRLSRDQDGIDGRIIRMICRDNGCVIMTPEKTYDFSMDADDDMADIHFLAAKVQKRENVRALVRGMVEKAKQGKMLPNRSPLGYRWDKSDEAGRKFPGAELVVDGLEAEIVRLIFDRYERLSQRKTALFLNEHGYKFPVKRPGDRHYGKTDRFFKPTDISRIVQNKLYAGILSWCENPKSRFTRNQEPIVHFRPELQIVSLEQFNRCQEIRRQRYKLPSRSVFSPFVFSGVLKCKHCGSGSQGMRQIRRRSKNRDPKEYRLYVCRRYHASGKTACKGQMVSENLVRKAVVPFLVNLLTQRLDLSQYIREAAESMQGPVEEKAERLRADIAEVEAGMRRLDEAIVAGATSVDRARAKNLELMERKERAERQLAALDERRELGGELADAVALLQTDMATVVWDLPDEALSRICKLVFKKIVVDVAGESQSKTSWVSAYEFTHEFADLVAHGTHLVGHVGQYQELSA